MLRMPYGLPMVDRQRVPLTAWRAGYGGRAGAGSPVRRATPAGDATWVFLSREGIGCCPELLCCLKSAGPELPGQGARTLPVHDDPHILPVQGGVRISGSEARNGA